MVLSSIPHTVRDGEDPGQACHGPCCADTAQRCSLPFLSLTCSPGIKNFFPQGSLPRSLKAGDTGRTCPACRGLESGGKAGRHFRSTQGSALIPDLLPDVPVAQLLATPLPSASRVRFSPILIQGLCPIPWIYTYPLSASFPQIQSIAAA